MEHTYITLEKESVAEYRDRGSRFIAYAYPLSSLEQFRDIRERLKKEHPKAVHHCFAYRLGTDGNRFRSSDNGEPSGTAGRPILGQIDSHKLTDVLVIVVRYFGGTLLGVPGLIQAYRTAAHEALQAVPHVQKPVLIPYRLQFDYTRMNEVMRFIRQYHGEIIKQDMQLFCVMEIGIPSSVHDEALGVLGSMPGVESTRITG